LVGAVIHIASMYSPFRGPESRVGKTTGGV
jgi:hypothetical protein